MINCALRKGGEGVRTTFCCNEMLAFKSDNVIIKNNKFTLNDNKDDSHDF